MCYTVQCIADTINFSPILHRFNQNKPLSTSVSLGTSETLKIGLTAKDNGKGKRPHQAFVVLKEQDTGVEAPFPLTVKDDGKAIAKIVCWLLWNIVLFVALY